MIEERRTTDQTKMDVAALLAVLYTVGFFGLVFLMLIHGIPKDNESSLNQLLGALTIIQTTIIAFYFGGSLANQQTQAANVARSLRSETAIQQIAQSAPAATAAAVAANVAASTATAATGDPLPIAPVITTPTAKDSSAVQPPTEVK